MGAPEGQASHVLGTTMFSGGTSAQLPGTSEDGRNLGVQVITWDFIVAEIGEDKGILDNDFAMAHRIKVQPHEAAVRYLRRRERRHGGMPIMHCPINCRGQGNH